MIEWLSSRGEILMRFMRRRVMREGSYYACIAWIRICAQWLAFRGFEMTECLSISWCELFTIIKWNRFMYRENEILSKICRSLHWVSSVKVDQSKQLLLYLANFRFMKEWMNHCFSHKYTMNYCMRLIPRKKNIPILLFYNIHDI